MSPARLAAVAACLALAGWFWQRGERFIAANGPTFDEGVHLAAGYSYWATGDFGLNSEDPPLLKLLWALPLVLGDSPPYPRDAAAAAGNNHWFVADALLYRSGVAPRSLLDPARRVNLALGCGLVLLAGWVSYRVWGSRLAGVAGCAFAATDPTLLALSCVLSTDVGVTLFGFLTCYLLSEYAAAPSRGLLVGAGVALGLALGAKFSAVGLAAGLVLAGAVFVWRGDTLALPGAGETRGVKPTFDFALRLAVVAVVALAATYAFLNFPEWGKGLKFQLTRGTHGDGVAYLNGEISRRGWFHYFLVALALKLPLGLLIAASVSAVSLFIGVTRNRPPTRLAPLGDLPLKGGGQVITSRLEGEVAAERSDAAGGGAALPQRESATGSPRLAAVWLLVPPAVFLALASYSRVNVGVRAVLPCVPFLYLLAAGLAAPGCCRVGWGVLLVGCLGWCAVAAQRANPQEIAYFNELAGGPEGGAKYLADSNLDWGQGLPALKGWMDANGVGVVYLAYFGTDRPEAHGIRFQQLPCYGRVGEAGRDSVPPDAPRHVVAVSANHLLGLFLGDPQTYAWLRDRPPTAVLAHSIHVFDLNGDPEAVARVRAIAADATSPKPGNGCSN